MRELGLEIGGEMMAPMDDGPYRQGEGQYPQVLHEIQPIPIPHEPPFPQSNLIGGQTFASTLLLSFSCAPLLRQHLLRTLNMTNDELASLEPVIAEAWDRWDHQVPPFFLSFYPQISQFPHSAVSTMQNTLQRVPLPLPTCPWHTTNTVIPLLSPPPQIQTPMNFAPASTDPWWPSLPSEPILILNSSSQLLQLLLTPPRPLIPISVAPSPQCLVLPRLDDDCR